MGLLEDLKAQGASSRITEEALYAEALREIEQGIRRDGLWAKALSQAKMQEDEARARYIELRVQALRDEIALIEKSMADAVHIAPKRNAEELTRPSSTSMHAKRSVAIDPERNRDPKTLKEWGNVAIGAIFIILIWVLLSNTYHWITGHH